VSLPVVFVMCLKPSWLKNIHYLAEKSIFTCKLEMRKLNFYFSFVFSRLDQSTQRAGVGRGRHRAGKNSTALKSLTDIWYNQFYFRVSKTVQVISINF